MTLVRDGRTMRFILVRAATPEALAATAPPGAQVLQPGEWLHWTRLPADACFVIAVQDLPAHVAAPSPGMQPLEP